MHDSSCKHPHDLPSYLLAKPRDIYWPIRMPPLYTTPAKSAAESEKPRTLESSIDFGTTCPRFIEQGSCPYGHKCRFLGGHTRKAVTGPDMTDTLPLVNANYVANPEEINTVGTNVLKSLRSRKVRSSIPFILAPDLMALEVPYTTSGQIFETYRRTSRGRCAYHQGLLQN